MKEFVLKGFLSSQSAELCEHGMGPLALFNAEDEKQAPIFGGASKQQDAIRRLQRVYPE